LHIDTLIFTPSTLLALLSSPHHHSRTRKQSFEKSSKEKRNKKSQANEKHNNIKSKKRSRKKKGHLENAFFPFLAPLFLLPNNREIQKENERILLLTPIFSISSSTKRKETKK